MTISLVKGIRQGQVEEEMEEERQRDVYAE